MSSQRCDCALLHLDCYSSTSNCWLTATEELTKLVASLPGTNRDLLGRVRALRALLTCAYVCLLHCYLAVPPVLQMFELLARVISYKDTNMMTVVNLNVCLSPNLARKDQPASFELDMERLFARLIADKDYVFWVRSLLRAMRMSLMP